MRFIISLLIVLIFSKTFSQQLVYPDNYLIPNNYQINEYGDRFLNMDVKTNGNIIVYTWIEAGVGSYNYAICYKVTDRWGNVLHDVDTINEPSNNLVYYSTWADVLPNNNFVITWTDGRNAAFGEDAYYQIFDSLGYPITNKIRINLDSTNTTQGAVPIALPNNGYCFILGDRILNPPSNKSDIWIQCFDSLHNRSGDYNYLGRYIPSGSWYKNLVINDTTLLITVRAQKETPPFDYYISSIRVNNKGEKLDSAWFEWDVTDIDSLGFIGDFEFNNNKIYAGTVKAISSAANNIVVARFHYDTSLILDTISPPPSKIIQETPWIIVNDDTLQTQIIRSSPKIGVMSNHNQIIISWTDHRNHLGCNSCRELFTQYFDTSLTYVGNNFLSANISLNQSVSWQWQNLITVASDYFVQLWEAERVVPFIHTKIWTNIWSLSTSIDEILQNDNVTIYPNPTSDKLNFKSDFKIEGYKIYDVTGKLISKWNISDSMIDVSHLQNGIYILNLINEKKQLNMKVKFIRTTNSQ